MNNKINPGDVYAIAIATIPHEHIDHYNSDLYLRKTPETTAIIEKLNNTALLSTFRDANGAVWYDLPFCFAPFWNDPQKYTGSDGGIK